MAEKEERSWADRMMLELFPFVAGVLDLELLVVAALCSVMVMCPT